MNLRNWTKQHTIGMLIGFATTVVAIFLVIGYFGWDDGRGYLKSFHNFTFFHERTAKVIALASIANLFWFHRFLKQEKWNLAMGVILATVVNMLVMLYFKFLA